MVNPRFRTLGRITREGADLQRRFKGLVQRGRVVAVNRLYVPAIVDVDIYGYHGQTARVRNVPTLSHAYDLRPTAATVVGADVLLLVPTGDISDGAYCLGAIARPANAPDLLPVPARGQPACLTPSRWFKSGSAASLFALWSGSRRSGPGPAGR